MGQRKMVEMDREREREKMDRKAVEKASWTGTPKVMVCLVAAQWMFSGGLVLQRGGALRRINGRGLWRGEAEGEKGRGESGPLWRGAISHLRTQPHTLTHIYTSAAAVTGQPPQPSPSLWM